MDDPLGLIKATQAQTHGQSGSGSASDEIDLERLAELVAEKLRDELAIENERIGRI